MIKNKLKLILIAWLTATLSACVTQSTFKNDETFYKRDLDMNIDGKDYEGFAVLKKTDKIKLKLAFKDKADLVWIKSCARSWEIEQAWKGRSFGFADRNTAKIDLDLQSPLEDREYCPIEFIGFSKSGKHTWGFVDTKTIEELPATLICNGQTTNHAGVSICQNYSGLLNEVRFSNPVDFKTDGCDVQRLSEKDFRFSNKKGFCLIVFKDKRVDSCKGENAKHCHRLTLIAYEAVLLKE